MLARLAVVAPAPPHHAFAPDDTCEIQVEGLPVPARSHHRLELSGGYVKLASDGTRVKVGVEPITVRLVGPRYTGEVQLAARDCTDDRVVLLQAIPRPAVVVFVRLAADLIVHCTDCEGELGRRPWRADELPPIPVGDGEVHHFELRAPGYRVLRRKAWLLPGENRMEVELVPIRPTGASTRAVIERPRRARRHAAPGGAVNGIDGLAPMGKKNSPSGRV